MDLNSYCTTSTWLTLMPHYSFYLLIQVVLCKLNVGIVPKTSNSARWRLNEWQCLGHPKILLQLIQLRKCAPSLNMSCNNLTAFIYSDYVS